MHSRPIIKNSKYWLYLGLTLFIVSSLGAGLATFNKIYLLDSLLGLVDWTAAFVIYFFYAAFLGLLIDKILDRKRGPHQIIPLWAKLTFSFAIFSIISIALSLRSLALGDLLFYLTYPFNYGIFFPGISYTLLGYTSFGNFIITKFILNTIFLTLFFSWLKISLNKSNLKFEKILIYIIFVILTLGMLKCSYILS